MKSKNANSTKSIVILGPTTSGKSDMAIDLARKIDGEIISADSRQIYRGLDIGSGKVERDPKSEELLKKFQQRIIPSPAKGSCRVGEAEGSSTSISASTKKKLSISETPYFSEGVVHWMIDIVSPNTSYNVAKFIKRAKKIEEDIKNCGKVPIICGGTGFWIQALVEDAPFPQVLPNQKLRTELETFSTKQLFDKLSASDPRRAKAIDSNNRVHLIRALEICDALGTVPKREIKQNDNYSIFCPDVPFEELKKKIETRLKKRFQQDMTGEVRQLHNKGVSWKRLEAFGLEYRWISAFLQGKVTEKEMHQKLLFDIIHYAKRQLTWIRRWERQGQKIYFVKSAEEIAKKSL